MSLLTPVALAIVVQADRVLVGRRAGDPRFPDHWEFPGGKIQPGEAPSDAAVRELEEETGLSCSMSEALLTFDHEYPGLSLRFHCFLVKAEDRTLPTVSPDRWKWVKADELSDLAIPAANLRILQALAMRESDE